MRPAYKTRPLALILSILGLLPAISNQPLKAVLQESPAVRLLKSGKVPPERLGTVIGIVGRQGTASDFSVILEKATDPKPFPRDIRIKALETLADAAANRKIIPDKNREGLLQVLPEPGQAGDIALIKAAIRNIIAWKLDQASPKLEAIAKAPKSPDDLRAESMKALGLLGGEANLKTLTALANSIQPTKTRVLALSALSAVAPDKAADLTVEFWTKGSTPTGSDISQILTGFLNKSGGPESLAKALESAKVPQDTAKLALRQLYAIGRSDAALVTALSHAAGIASEIKAPTDAELKVLMDEVASKGDAKRGEEIFRREENSCFKCHALSGAGGQVGPELSDVGTVSPVDYLLNSVMVPELAVKELYQMMTVLTTDGRIVQGIIVDQDEQGVKLKDADGKEFALTTAEIEEKKLGGSLMPKGLPNLMTRQEFVDLIRFLSELGKPGPYARKTTTTVQRWKVLTAPPEELGSPAPDNQVIQTLLNAPAGSWNSAYAKFDGTLPLEPVLKNIKENPSVIYLQGEVEVTGRGQTRISVGNASGVTAWINDQPIKLISENTSGQKPGQFLIPIGRQKLTFRVDLSKHRAEIFRAEFLPVEFGQAILTVIGGK
jgi:putative heme-binding domain-containing protein